MYMECSACWTVSCCWLHLQYSFVWLVVRWWHCDCCRSSVSKSASKPTESSSLPVASASPVKSAPVSSVDSSANCSTEAVDQSPSDKPVSSTGAVPATAALDNGSLVCETTNWLSLLLLASLICTRSVQLVLYNFCQEEYSANTVLCVRPSISLIVGLMVRVEVRCAV